MTYQKRMTFWVLLDSLIVLSAIYVSYFILHPQLQIFTSKVLLVTSITLLISHHLFASIYKLYNKAWEYASVGELVAIVKAVTWSVLMTAIFQQVIIGDIYFRALIMTWMLHVILIGGSRFSWRIYRDRYIKPQPNLSRALIVGAGAAGTMLVKQLKNNRDTGILPVAFIDDNPTKYKLQIYGIPVVGNSQTISNTVEKLRIDKIIIAIPSLSKEEMQKIFDECAKTKAKTVKMPRIEDIMLGKLSVNQFRDVQVEDLLGREPVELDIESISKTIKGKTILVTGAGGSIGSEISRQICKFQPSKILLLGHGENSIYQIDMELKNQYKDEIEIIPVIADIQDRERIFETMDRYKPHVIYHAAAHKHVPLMEYNPKEAVKNNILGTRNVAEAADTFSVDTFVMISSDKAVNPTNVMGSTKRIAEMVVQQLDQHSKTKFVAVRFGNVLGSRGSVIPLFKKQIQIGGPVTVTHPDMTRYFMTIPEASRLVLQAGSLAEGGEVFVLDMGEPVKIVDLAKNLIQLSGYTIEEIGIQYTGIRPGEKMYEELLGDKEIHKQAVFPKIFIGKAVLDQENEVQYLIEQFSRMNSKEIREFVLNVANKRKNNILSIVK
ncbi:polysaccharide biosynthesis protein [Cytobacillus horneckiae]|uniref:Polysaccharide biosynthesis protein n=1 Tax=Cytobacillus horneckiae TaxID=549687 RepID=A0A2N0ZFU9_9BACI|nr:nucleoside-diphosphate sugar epimerase/dehydratase [Cytobacillus horneckiae]MEC1154379.1 nucleoside-diphosphate sugar epimerase/dehydratase [Cytobacillus horneckiae]MED2937714.1 nucleoside-diphosphate sugar epimerase/dehydratase [Cytobacillus horneckiae]PKG28363.1 polysaccharide biosynthesis protein [Cytobacillus horneckiae]